MSSASVKTKNIAEYLKKKDKRELNGGEFTWRCCSRYPEDQPYSVFARIDGICVVWCLLYCHYPFFYSNSRFVYLYICIGVCVRVCFPSALFVCLPFCHCYYSHLPYLPLPLWAQVSWFVSERQHNRQQQCASNHSHHFFPLTSPGRQRVMSLLWFCYSMLCGNSSNLVGRVKDVKENEFINTP